MKTLVVRAEVTLIITDLEPDKNEGKKEGALEWAESLAIDEAFGDVIDDIKNVKVIEASWKGQKKVR